MTRALNHLFKDELFVGYGKPKWMPNNYSIEKL